MRPVTRNPHADPKKCFAYACDGKQADAWISDLAQLAGVDLDEAFSTGEIKSEYIKSLHTVAHECKDAATRNQRLARLKNFALMDMHYALGMVCCPTHALLSFLNTAALATPLPAHALAASTVSPALPPWPPPSPPAPPRLRPHCNRPRLLHGLPFHSPSPTTETDDHLQADREGLR